MLFSFFDSFLRHPFHLLVGMVRIGRAKANVFELLAALIMICSQARLACRCWKLQRQLAYCAVFESCKMLSLMDDPPLFWITTSWYIRSEHYILVNRELMITLCLVFGKDDSWVNLDSQHLHAYHLLLLLDAVLIIDHSSNPIITLKLIKRIVDDESF